MWQICMLLLSGCILTNGFQKQSTDQETTEVQEKLTSDVIPYRYHIFLQPFPSDGYFEGQIKINIKVIHNTKKILLNAHPDLILLGCNITQLKSSKELRKKKFKKTGGEFMRKTINIESLEKVKNTSSFSIILQRNVEPVSFLEVSIQFTGKLSNSTSEGLFGRSYIDSITNETKWYVGTSMKPNTVIFPCFDEPSYKVPMKVSVARHMNMTAASNMPLESTKPHESMEQWVWDTFQETPPMTTYSFGIVISELSHLTYSVTNQKDVTLRIWGRSDIIVAMQNITESVNTTLNILQGFFGVKYPLPKLDIFALPNYEATNQVVSWGLLLINENKLSDQEAPYFVYELEYQWFGNLASPLRWGNENTDSALDDYITIYIIRKMNQPNHPYNNLDLIILYSVCYESGSINNSTWIRDQLRTSTLYLLFKMLNFTLGEKTFISGIQRFINERQYSTFVEDDIWLDLTEQARLDNKLPQQVTIKEIVDSWKTTESLPMVKVTRNYDEKTANLNQKVFLRQRPHDLPDQEKYLWWIPIVLVTQNHLQFSNTTPHTWMKKEKDITISNLTDKNMFIIINPEEIGPFLVNYDTRNWNLLSLYLCSENRTKIPVATRAKLLHDSWNLAYAGDLNFATALNMTLFLKHEREHVVWTPMFNMIDHIGRHISGSPVYEKFQMFVKSLLIPLYEELGGKPQKEHEDIVRLREYSKTILLNAGYRPCLDEAREAYKQWMKSSNPDEDYVVMKRSICPILKWGTLKEWEFVLERVSNFSSGENRMNLLRSLAGCPRDSYKIDRLLTTALLERNENFTDEDSRLIFIMLTGNANGYTSLFNFLRKNWNALKKRLGDKPHLWNILISSATSCFKTRDGFEMISELYVERRDDFGTADMEIRRALRKVKEEAEWSKENLPVIEKWMDQHVLTH